MGVDPLMTVLDPAVGIIGFGEAGSTIASGLHSACPTRLSAYDIQIDSPVAGPRIQQRAHESVTTLVSSPAELSGASDVLLSTVTASSALDAAKQSAPHLTSRHLYADLNSVSPALKRQIDEVITKAGARFVEVAVMAPVQPYGHRVPMLLCGPAAAAFAETMAPFGMRLQLLSPSAKIGSAAAVKMCRSIIVKGLEALMVECVLGATCFEADDLVFASLNESFPGIDWKKLADYMTNRVIVHGERRAHEMEEVSATLRAIGIEPIMAEATAKRQAWSARLQLASRFGPEGPSTYRALIDALTAMKSEEAKSEGEV